MKTASPTFARIDLDAFIHNYQEIRKFVGPQVEMIPVLKSDAYGHGLPLLARTSVDLGARILGVGMSAEGELLRNEKIQADILLLDGLLKEEIPSILKHDLISVVSSAEALKQLSRAAGRKKIRVHVKVNTGMNRLGLAPGKVIPFFREAARLKNVQVDGLMTHFACADDLQNPFTKRQILMFNQIQKLLCKNGISIPRIHAANSAAIVHFPVSHYTAVRPGIALYGYLPCSTDRVRLVPVMNLIGRVVAIQEIRKGDGVGYGWTGFRANSVRRIGVLTAGYAHGVFRLLSNRCQAIIRGKKVPQVGTICMDNLMVDLTDLPKARIGDPAILIGGERGQRISAQDLADAVGTIPYEILTHISSRIPRVYWKGNRPAGG